MSPAFLRRESVSKAAPFIVAGLAMIILVGTALALGGPARDQAVAAITDAPTPTAAPVAVVPSGIDSTALPSVQPAESPTTSLEPRPTRTPKPTDRADPTAAPAPEPTPAPTPAPTPPKCEVVDLVGLKTNRAQATWTDAGFKGTVTFSPEWPPHYTITAQSLTPGDLVRCSSGITVQGAP